MKAYRVFAAVSAFAIILVFGAGGFGAVTYAMAKKSDENKAIILLPGLFASGLYDTATGKGVWDPLESLDIRFGDIYDGAGINLTGIAPLMEKEIVFNEVMKILDNGGKGAPDSLFNLMAINEDGTPAVSTLEAVPFASSSRLRYGVVNAQKDMYDFFQTQYGEEYDVQVFNYDFRLDNRESARRLEEFINSKHYQEIILVSHSNGGEVAAGYLARSEANRSKVKKYLSYNSPYYGSFSAIDILEDIEGMVEGMTDMIGGMIPGAQALITNIVQNQALRLLNMWPVFQLLPSYELLTQEYGGEQAGYFIDGEYVHFANQEELWEFYCSRPWAKTAEGELRVPMQQWLDYRDSLMVALEDGTKVLSTTLVDTVYYTGSNVPGSYQTHFHHVGEELRYLGSYGTMMGDGVVLYSSAVAFTKDPARIVVFMGQDHYGVVTDFDGIAASSSKREVDSYILAKEKPWYTEMWEILGKK
jgi:pimeloyl-ACP methyl ester carboxylesterase